MFDDGDGRGVKFGHEFKRRVRIIDIIVNIIAILKLSQTVGCKSKNGNINNCINVDKIKPLPTSIKVSIKFLIHILLRIF